MNLVSSSGADQLSVRMVHSQVFCGHELSSSGLTQLSQFNPAYTSADTFESPSKDQLTTSRHFTNKFLVLAKPKANLAMNLDNANGNKPWKPCTLL